MYVIRKISRAKWEAKAGIAADEISADAVTADLRTTDNALSLWKCDSSSGVSFDDAVLALVAGADRIDKIDVVWIAHAAFETAGVCLQETAGRTPVDELSDRHIDAVKLDFVRLGKFAEQVVDSIAANQYKRLTKKAVAKLIASAVASGRVALEALEAKVQDEVIKLGRVGSAE